ncbi:MAG: Membrane protein-like protein [Microgenomates group bacterium GW2011_GWC1_43_13]|uniref:Membrane protein-like protein n=3 Tax=Candidatus Woeseibacteriota TaxID=1752722 RepID=A0A837I9E3_9BACT|nr:MAG: Membrane protein-like protein [Microgenomates group bacterium GW2011_GWC1_43_13]KKT33183.1 MAG: Membrane protein-like protein [Candidatus Woesebacteria bacterium GW2011_GWB1_44_11]KKT54479.1 MAG: Membrane protein-like protein [Candidatus Woesebacteria bacterium GW2011_GWA1_44_23]OGM75884.1 MAG: hypothetical protein A2208_01935 [Candidatus Woesebacteria bacterium RIFOXYA1_FULL_43_16]OGM84420.1 MAG: hypothetical protein A2421_01365 [Candidatus Woesebacteria bacterium RIFOXYC1_FULL_43_18]
MSEIQHRLENIRTVADLKREFAPIVNTNEIHRNRLSKTDKVALSITRRVGTMGFFYFCLIFVTIPLIFSAVMPTFQYLSSGFLQLILLPLILIQQNLQSRHDELRAQHDYETNIKAEKEIEAILLHLEKQDEVMRKILQKIETLEKAGK